MAIAFKYFVIFAEMRTGSNFLQSHLNKFPDLHCFGELFNPVFIDRPGQSSALGLSMADRDKNPVSLLREVKKKWRYGAGVSVFSQPWSKDIKRAL